jgi:hypothetical protein
MQHFPTQCTSNTNAQCVDVMQDGKLTDGIETRTGNCMSSSHCLNHRLLQRLISDQPNKGNLTDRLDISDNLWTHSRPANERPTDLYVTRSCSEVVQLFVLYITPHKLCKIKREKFHIFTLTHTWKFRNKEIRGNLSHVATQDVKLDFGFGLQTDFLSKGSIFWRNGTILWLRKVATRLYRC